MLFSFHSHTIRMNVLLGVYIHWNIQASILLLKFSDVWVYGECVRVCYVSVGHLKSIRFAVIWIQSGLVVFKFITFWYCMVYVCVCVSQQWFLNVLSQHSHVQQQPIQMKNPNFTHTRAHKIRSAYRNRYRMSVYNCFIFISRHFAQTVYIRFGKWNCIVCVSLSSSTHLLKLFCGHKTN